MSTGSHRPPLLRFAAFELNLQSGELRKAGSLVSLPPQPLKILALLSTRSGELVTREEIQKEVWGDATVVDFERGLNFAINKIRSALGDNAETPRFIETLPRRGYRFLCPVQRIETLLPEAVEPPPPPMRPGIKRFIWPAAACLGIIALLALARAWGFRVGLPQGPTPVRIVSVAVIPFENLSHIPAEDYLADGATGSLITQLGGVSALRVISRTSSIRYRNSGKALPQIGRELGADAVVEGTVLRSASRIRITAQLIETATDKHLWAQSYDRELKDVLNLQGEVAWSITKAIQVRLTPEERATLTRTRAVRPEAYEHYLRGHFFWNKMTADGLNKSIADFQQAVQKDPGYALAYAGMADCYANLPYTYAIAPQEAYRKAKAAANKALEIEPDLAEAISTLATVAAYAFEWPEAERLFKRTLALNPSHAQAHHDYGFYLLAMGRVNETTDELLLARALDPLSLNIAVDLAFQQYFLRRFDQAIPEIEKVMEMDRSYPMAYVNIGLVYGAKGMADKEIAAFRKARDLDPDNPLILAYLGNALAKAEKTADARRLLHELETMASKRFVSAFHFALIQLGLGEKDRAFSSLEKAYEERFFGMALIKLDPFFDSVRSDPRFADLVRKMGLR